MLLLQLDGRIPNLALMRLAAHHQARGDHVELGRLDTIRRVERRLLEADKVYASLIFERTISPDYSLYPWFTASLGFSQRGCRLKCPFCIVGRKEGAVREEQTITQLWRGEPWPRHLLLLDNDFFGQPAWRERIQEIRDGNFKVSFCQGINARMLTDETAEAIASVRYSDDGFTTRRLYTAWDNRKDEARLFRGLEALVRYGVKPEHIMVYMLVGYWPGETAEDRDYRRRRLREFGCKPYPMPFVRTPELVGFQRWVVRWYDLVSSWAEWQAAGYNPYGLRLYDAPPKPPRRRMAPWTQARRARQLARLVPVLGTHGGARFQADNVSLGKRGGNSSAYRVARLKRDYPYVAEALARGEFASVAAAWRAATRSAATVPWPAASLGGSGQ